MILEQQITKEVLKHLQKTTKLDYEAIAKGCAKQYQKAVADAIRDSISEDVYDMVYRNLDVEALARNAIKALGLPLVEPKKKKVS